MLTGIFVGGSATRMQGAPKGLLLHRGEPLVVRLARVAREAGSDVVLVGRADAYAALSLPAIADAPDVAGPLGGLVALFEAAGSGSCIALAGDMPAVGSRLFARLVDHASRAVALAPRIEGKWQPLFARYQAEPALAAARRVVARGERALFRVLEELGPAAVELPLDDAERAELRDWDEPRDVEA